MAVVMGVLIVSFAVWGIADIFKGFGQSSLAKVGGTEISTEQFRQIYTDKLQQLGRSFGRPLTSEQARAFGLDRQVLQQTIAEAALDEEARRMGLAQSQEETMRLIYSDPNFKGLGGAFDPARFQATIRQFGYTEQRYLAEQRRVGLRRQIVGTVSADIEPSKVLIDALTRFQNEQRSIEYVKLDAAQAGTIDPPSPEALAAYFEDHKTQFRAPEYRKLSFVVINPEEIGKWTEVSDEDAKKIFELEPRQARYAGEARGVADRVSQRRGSAGRAQPHRVGNVVRRSRQGAQSQSFRRRPRPDRKNRDHRSGDRGCGVFAAVRRSQPAGARPVRRGAGQDRQDRAGRDAHV